MMYNLYSVSALIVKSVVINSDTTVNSAAGFSAEQKATLLTWSSKKSQEKSDFFTSISLQWLKILT